MTTSRSRKSGPVRSTDPPDRTPGERLLDLEEDVAHQERRLALQSEDAVRCEHPRAPSIERLVVEAGARADGVAPVEEDHVERLGVGFLHERDAVADTQVEPRIVPGGADGGQVRPARLDDLRVDLDHDALLDLGVLQDLAGGATVAAPDHEGAADPRCAGHRRVHEHLVVEVLLQLAGLIHAVEREHPPVSLGLEELDLLEVALLAHQMAPDLHPEPSVILELLVVPLVRHCVAPSCAPVGIGGPRVRNVRQRRAAYITASPGGGAACGVRVGGNGAKLRTFLPIPLAARAGALSLGSHG